MLIFKTHHSLVDGVSGVDLATVLFDMSRDPPEPPTDLEPWQPHREPSPAELVVAGVRGAVRTTAELAVRTVAAVARPANTLGALRDAAEGIGEIVWAGLNPAPETPLNVEIGPHRRFAVVRRLATYKEIKDALGGTVNDVVLTVVSGALTDWLHSRGVRTKVLEMRRARPRVRPHQRRPGHAREQADGDARPAPRVYPGSARAAAVRAQGDGCLKEYDGGRHADARTR